MVLQALVTQFLCWKKIDNPRTICFGFCLFFAGKTENSDKGNDAILSNFCQINPRLSQFFALYTRSFSIISRHGEKICGARNSVLLLHGLDFDS